MSEQPDSLLLKGARMGDLDAFAELVRRYERRIRSMLAHMLDDERDVEEATQDTFVQAWRNVGRFRGDSATFTWLYRIAANEALQRLRRKRLDTSPLEDVPELDLEGPGRSPVWLGPEAEAENRDLSAFLSERVRSLPWEFRAPLILRDVEGLSNQEVADILGLSLPAVKSRIHRARMKLRGEIVAWRRDQRPPGRPRLMQPAEFCRGL